MGVWAHPDDETWASAGLMMAAIANGQRVAVVTATRGELGSVDPVRWPLDALAQVRQRELAAALNLIGVTDHYWLDYKDGECAGINPLNASLQLTQIIDQVCPDTILTFGPDGLTGHADHKTIGKWAHLAVTASACKPIIYEVTESKEKYESVGKQCDQVLHIYFNTDKPYMLPEADMDICFRLTPELLSKKIEVLRAHTSQTEKLMECIQNGTITTALVSPECFKKTKLPISSLV